MAASKNIYSTIEVAPEEASDTRPSENRHYQSRIRDLEAQISVLQDKVAVDEIKLNLVMSYENQVLMNNHQSETVVELQKKMEDKDKEIRSLRKRLRIEEGFENEDRSKTEVVMNEILESHFQCAICSDLLTKSVSLNCGHLFCKPCVDLWRKKSKSLQNQKPTCPICRSHIKMQAPVKSIDSFIEKTFDVFYTPESKRLRAQHVNGASSEASTSTSRPSPQPVSPPVASPSVNISIFIRDYLN